MLFDTHMHCQFSCDSKMDFAEAAEAAAKQNIGITVTEHWDYDYPTNPEAFVFDPDKYFAALQPWRSDSLLAGIEIGMQRHTAAQDDLIAGSYPFDYVLGAIHCVGGRDLYESSCYEGRLRQEIVEEFLSETIACLEQQRDFDALAHIDYICRYWPYAGEERELLLTDAPGLFDRLFKLLIDKEKPLEINTRRLGDACAAAAMTKLYRRYAELGGRFCTLGSDAHFSGHVGRRLREALQLAGECGLQPVYFKERQLRIIEVP